MKKEHKGSGHRKRLRERFLLSGLDGFLDYEIIELLLTLGTPRRDCKQLAKDAIDKFGGLKGVLDSTLEELQQINGIGKSNAIAIKLFQSINKKYFAANINAKALVKSPSELFSYLREKIGREKKENFVVICLDTKNKIIEETVSVGTLNASLVHPREVFNKAIILRASHIIVAHNHPTGDPAPSRADNETTARLVECGKLIGISVVDHLIITQSGYFSYKEQGFLR